jgi:rhamnosyltransferase
VYAPLFPLADMFDAMADRDIDHWAITGCSQIAPHLQSYFRVFRSGVVSDPLFTAFWDAMTPVTDKMELVTRYEVGFCQILDAAGYVGAAYFAPGRATESQLRLLKAPSLLALQCDLDYDASVLSAADIVADGYNISLAAWPMLIYSRIPTLKVMLLQENPAKQSLDGLLATLERISHYDVDLIRNHLVRMRRVAKS